MKNVNFKKVKILNFLSIGKTPVEIEFTPGIHLITGINRDKIDRRNGVGKCVDPCTEIEIIIEDTTVLEKYKNIILQ